MAGLTLPRCFLCWEDTGRMVKFQRTDDGTYDQSVFYSGAWHWNDNVETARDYYSDPSSTIAIPESRETDCSQNAAMKSLITTLHQVIHSGKGSMAGATDAELAAFIDDEMCNLFGNDWAEQ